MKGRSMFWRKWFPTQRMGRIDLKKMQIVLWDEFDLEEGVKPNIGYLSASSRKSHPDQASEKIVTPNGLVSPGKKGTA
jgi:hypothetical protein